MAATVCGWGSAYYGELGETRVLTTSKAVEEVVRMSVRAAAKLAAVTAGEGVGGTKDV